MRAGRLDRRIKIQRRTGALTVSGQPFDAWNDVATRWASVAPVRGTEGFSTPQLIAKEQVEISIRWSAATADLHPADRVLFPSASGSPTALYNIIAVHEIGRREGQRIIAERLPVPDSGIPDPFDPALLGVRIWLDPSDLASLYIDEALTTTVTADGQIVAAVANKGTLGGHLVASEPAQRATFRTETGIRWLEWNANGVMFSNQWTVAQPYIRISGFRRLAGASGVATFLGQEASRLYTESGELKIAAGATFPGPPVPDIGIDFVATERFAGAGSAVAIDGGVDVIGDAGISGLSSFTVSGLFGAPASYNRIRFAGLMVFPSLTAAEIANARNFVAGKQGRPPFGNGG